MNIYVKDMSKACPNLRVIIADNATDQAFWDALDGNNRLSDCPVEYLDKEICSIEFCYGSVDALIYI